MGKLLQLLVASSACITSKRKIFLDSFLKKPIDQKILKEKSLSTFKILDNLYIYLSK